MSIVGWDKEGTILVVHTFLHKGEWGYFKLIEILDSNGNWTSVNVFKQKKLDIFDIIFTDNGKVVVMHSCGRTGKCFSVLTIIMSRK